MLTVAHIADPHLGVQLHGGDRRITDFIDTFQRAVQAAVKGGADLLAIAGDLFDNPHVSADVLLAAAEILDAAVEAGMSIAVVRGNATHDGRQLELLDRMVHRRAASSVRVFWQLGAEILQTRHGEVFVAAIPAPARSQYLGLEENRRLSVPEANRQIARACMNLAQGYAAGARGGLPAVLLFHGSVTGLSLSGQHNLLEINEPVLDAGELNASRFDLVCMGHIHKAQQIGQKCFYAGSLERTDFGEEGEDKGFWMHVLNPEAPPGQRLISSNWVESGAREMLTVTLTSAKQDLPDKCDDAIVRVKLDLPPEEQATLDIGEMERRFYEDFRAFYVFIAPPESKDDILVRAAEETSDAVLRSPADALREYKDLIPPPDEVNVEAFAAELEEANLP